MDSALKQRLVGAVVLVALAVIFLPMLLDGSGADQRLNEQVAIPEKPEQPVSQFDQPIEQADAADDAQATASQSVDANTGSISSPTSTTESTEPTATSETQATAEASSASQSDTAADASTDTTTPADGQDNGSSGSSSGNASDANTSAAKDEITEGWVVQVGSFHRQTNALVMRDKLRKAGFDADAESVQGENGTLWRVLLGPVAQKEQGQALQKRYEQDHGSDTLLRGYP